MPAAEAADVGCRSKCDHPAHLRHFSPYVPFSSPGKTVHAGIRPDRPLATLDNGLDEAAAKGWTVVSMKNDWKQVFPFEVTAIDILLEPNATMLAHCKANNARLLREYPKGFALDATHTPHITMLQCFVRTADLDKLYAAEEKVFAAADVTAMKLEAFKLLLRPDRCDRRCRYLRKADAGDPQATGGRHRRSKAVHVDDRPRSVRSRPGTTIPPSTRPSSIMCPRSCRR